jgi:hypothetical protein
MSKLLLLVTNNIVLPLATDVAGSKIKQFIQDKAAKEADKQLDAVVKDGAAFVIERGKEALGRLPANRKNRGLANQLAGQIGGTYSAERAIIAGDRYWVVFAQDGTPFEAFPPLPEDLGPLAERRELQNYQGDRIDPSADSS